jgi:hypothetical protein
MGFWLTNVVDISDRKNVSERAIHRTFWPAEDEGEYYWISQWGRMVSKSGEVYPRFGEPGCKPMARFR